MRQNDHSQEDKRRQEEADRRRKAYEQQAQQRQRQAEIDRQNQQAYRQQKKREQMQNKRVGMATKAAANVAGHMTKNTVQRNAKLEGQIEQVVGKVLGVSEAEAEGLAKKQNAKRYGQQQGERVKKAVLNASKTVKQYKSIDVEVIDPTLSENNQRTQTGPQFDGYGHYCG